MVSLYSRSAEAVPFSKLSTNSFLGALSPAGKLRVAPAASSGWQLHCIGGMPNFNRFAPHFSTCAQSSAEMIFARMIPPVVSDLRFFADQVGARVLQRIGVIRKVSRRVLVSDLGAKPDVRRLCQAYAADALPVVLPPSTSSE